MVGFFALREEDMETRRQRKGSRGQTKKVHLGDVGMDAPLCVMMTMWSRLSVWWQLSSSDHDLMCIFCV